jgi:prepilin-type N-terminal cleavage/methylation domain-containing protein
MRYSPPQRRRPRGSGFTLIELLVVIAILVVLASILIPTISHVRTSVHQTNTASRVQALSNAIENYFHVFNAYPGPVADTELVVTGGNPPVGFPDFGTGKTLAVTGTENLTLALSGGLYMAIAGGPQLKYDASKVGNGALSLSAVKAAQRYGPYIEAKIGGLEPQASNSQWLAWSDSNHPGERPAFGSQFGDGVIPEYTDAYPDALPILYIRAKLGATGSIIGAMDTSGTAVVAANAAYDPGQLQPYVFPALALGSTASATPVILNNAFANPSSIDPQVLQDFGPNSSNPVTTPANYFGQYIAPAVPRSKGYLLITAGPDRKYMTKDDTINNGSAVK